MSNTRGATPPDTNVDWSTEETPAFVNGARVLCSGEDVALVFTEFQNFSGRAALPGGVAPRERVVSSLRMTPSTFFQIMASFASTWNQYVLENEKPDVVPRFKLIGPPNVKLAGSDEIE
jgi:hypothetical protein